MRTCHSSVQGANRKSYGLDVNVLICCIIVFGDTASTAPDGSKVVAADNSVVVDDLGAQGPRKRKKQKLSPLMAILVAVFGKNASKIQQVFEAWTGYAQLYDGVNDAWTDSTDEYKKDRASTIYRAGVTHTRTLSLLLLPIHTSIY